MTNKRSARNGRVMQLAIAGAATVATLALFGATPLSPQVQQAAPSVSGAGGFAADDPGNSVNDNGQTSGDIFTQNAQDQSTA